MRLERSTLESTSASCRSKCVITPLSLPVTDAAAVAMCIALQLVSALRPLSGPTNTSGHTASVGAPARSSTVVQLALRHSEAKCSGCALRDVSPIGEDAMLWKGVVTSYP